MTFNWKRNQCGQEATAIRSPCCPRELPCDLEPSATPCPPGRRRGGFSHSRPKGEVFPSPPLRVCVCARVCLTLYDPMDCSPPGFSVRGDSPGKNAGVGCHAFLQGIFPTQGPDLIPAESGFTSVLHAHLMGGRGYTALCEIALLLASQTLPCPFLLFSHVFQPILGPQRMGSSTDNLSLWFSYPVPSPPSLPSLGMSLLSF